MPPLDSIPSIRSAYDTIREREELFTFLYRRIMIYDEVMIRQVDYAASANAQDGDDELPWDNDESRDNQDEQYYWLNEKWFCTEDRYLSEGTIELVRNYIARNPLPDVDSRPRIPRRQNEGDPNWFTLNVFRTEGYLMFVRKMQYLEQTQEDIYQAAVFNRDSLPSLPESYAARYYEMFHEIVTGRYEMGLPVQPAGFVDSWYRLKYLSKFLKSMNDKKLRLYADLIELRARMASAQETNV